MSLSEKKTWLCLRLSTLPCLLSEECIIFNVTCYSNGKIIFHGINNTAYIGKKTFQLQKNRIIALNEFIQTNCFMSDIQSIKILLRIELSHNNNHYEIYFWRNDTITYTILASLLNIDTLSSYKHWSILLRTAHILSNIQQRKVSEHSININSKPIQKFKRSLKNQNSIRSTRTKRMMIIPIAESSYRTNDNNDIFPDNMELIVPSIQTLGLITEKFNDDVCFSSQVIQSKFDLIDACLSTNDIIGDNQFYALRDQFKWPNELIDSQETATSESTSYTTLISTSVTEQTTLSPDEILASLGQTTISFNGTSEAATTISSVNTILHTTLSASNETVQSTVSTSAETLYSTSSGSNETVQTTVIAAEATFHTTTGPSNEILQPPVITSAETLYSTSSGSNETVQTTVGAAETTFHTTIGPSDETLQSTLSTSGESNETVQTTVSAAEATFHTTIGPSNETSQSTLSTSGETFHSTLSGSNETVQTTISAADTTLHTTVGPFNETLRSTPSTSGESNETVQTTVSAAETTLHTTIGPSNETSQSTLSTSGESNETVQTTVSAAEATFHTTLGPSNETSQSTLTTSGETFHSTLSGSNETPVNKTIRDGVSEINQQIYLLNQILEVDDIELDDYLMSLSTLVGMKYDQWRKERKKSGRSDDSDD
ncbi:unnamed protein product [Rotaria sp. Silwood2]|nr:unnamed protein product [Rotaria sp. Silwood2]